MASAIILLDSAGPLPLESVFNSPVIGPATFVLSGTSRTASAPCLTGITLYLDGNRVGSAMCWANQDNNHIAMRSSFLPVENLTYGEHTIELRADYQGTVTDQNDYFQVTLLL